MRDVTVASRLRRGGVVSVARAEKFLANPALAAIQEKPERLDALSDVADPDMAILELLRLAEALGSADFARLVADAELWRQVLLLLGMSRALGEYLIADPGRLATLREPLEERSGAAFRARMMAAVGAQNCHPGWEVAAPTATRDDLRRSYRQQLLHIVCQDLASNDPVAAVPEIARQMSALVSGTMAGALALARREVDPECQVGLTVIAMGKTGAQELNYISDVDVVFVAGPGQVPDKAGEPSSEAKQVEIGTAIAQALTQHCVAPSGEPPLWPIDTALRPEGKDGALVRTLPSFTAYYRRWAKAWEFQALLKARPVAGDWQLGEDFLASLTPLIWAAAGREGFVEESRAMRRQVEASIPAGEIDRQLKLGPGGLRDVEFSVQLLQLVHGRTDETLRVANTWHALAALAAGGYVGREQAQELGDCYRFLRLLEHRAQLYRMARTHVLPSKREDLRRLARSIDPESFGEAENLERRWRTIRNRVRALHEDVFYRPLLPATAQLSPDDVALTPEAAKARLAAMGYLDPGRAMAHIEALTAGVTRRAKIQRNLLPVMLGWIADGADPDAGLLNFRRLSETIGDSHWYMGLLRDSGAAAQRLCHLLPNSTFVAQALTDIPEGVKWLDRSQELIPRSKAQLAGEAQALIQRHPGSRDAMQRVRTMRWRETARAAVGDVLGGIDPARAGTMITPMDEVTLAAALEVAQREEEERTGVPRPKIAFIGLGRFGGSESGYCSDADVLVVHADANGERNAAAAVPRVIGRIRALLSEAGPDQALVVDIDLRPEGRNGPVSRTLDSYAEYYHRWMSPWERHALVRARPVAGDADLGQRFMDLVDPLRFPREISEKELREIRRIKARMEAERMPHGVPPNRQVKLGPGGLVDIEWTVQLLQLLHAHEKPGMQITGTLPVLRAAVAAGVVTEQEGQRMATAWTLATRIRAANGLASGRLAGPKVDVLPRARREIIQVGRILGYQDGQEHELEEDYLRAARRCRAVTQRLFFG